MTRGSVNADQVGAEDTRHSTFILVSNDPRRTPKTHERWDETPRRSFLLCCHTVPHAAHAAPRSMKMEGFGSRTSKSPWRFLATVVPSVGSRIRDTV